MYIYAKDSLDLMLLFNVLLLYIIYFQIFFSALLVSQQVLLIKWRTQWRKLLKSRFVSDCPDFLTWSLRYFIIVIIIIIINITIIIIIIIIINITIIIIIIIIIIMFRFHSLKLEIFLFTEGRLRLITSGL